MQIVAALKNGSPMQKRDQQPRKPRRAEIYVHMIDCMIALLGDLGINYSAAQVAANRLADHMANRWGGQVVSMTIDNAFPLSRRELLILATCKQSTLADAARVYGMTGRGLQDLLRRAPRRSQGIERGQS